MSRAADLSIAFFEAQPVGAARVLETIPADDAAAFVAGVPAALAATVLGHMQSAHVVALLERSKPKIAATLLWRMPTSARTVALRALPESVRERALAALSRTERAAMRRYLAYAPDSVGAWMQTPKATFAPDTTVAACLQQARQLGERLGGLLFVVDGERRLRGCVDVDAMLNADDGETLQDIMRSDVPAHSPQASLTTVAAAPAWDTAAALPVVDRSRRLVGVLSFDGVRDGLAADQSAPDGPPIGSLLAHLSESFLVTLTGLLDVTPNKSVRSRQAVARRSA